MNRAYCHRNKVILKKMADGGHFELVRIIATPHPFIGENNMTHHFMVQLGF